MEWCERTQNPRGGNAVQNTLRLTGVAIVIVSMSSLLLNSQLARVAEPIFGIEYNPHSVHFDRAPALIGNRCKDMRGRALVVYAHLISDDNRYFIVQEHGGEFGVAVRIRGTNCAEVDSDRFLYEGPKSFSDQGDSISSQQNQDLMNKMADGILDQYAKAFGGKKRFLAALGSNADHIPDSPLRTKLTEFKRHE
jgi:hypothetical protein